MHQAYFRCCCPALPARCRIRHPAGHFLVLYGRLGKYCEARAKEWYNLGEKCARTWAGERPRLTWSHPSRRSIEFLRLCKIMQREKNCQGFRFEIRLLYMDKFQWLKSRKRCSKTFSHSLACTSFEIACCTKIIVFAKSQQSWLSIKNLEKVKMSSLPTSWRICILSNYLELISRAAYAICELCLILVTLFSVTYLLCITKYWESCHYHGKCQDGFLQIV